MSSGFLRRWIWRFKIRMAPRSGNMSSTTWKKPRNIFLTVAWARNSHGSAAARPASTCPATLLYRFSYRRVSTSNLKIGFDPNLVPLLLQPVRVGMLSSNYIQDRRDDPIDPRKGIYNTVDVGLASKVFGSQVSFGRGLARN